MKLFVDRLGWLAVAFMALGMALGMAACEQKAADEKKPAAKQAPSTEEGGEQTEGEAPSGEAGEGEAAGEEGGSAPSAGGEGAEAAAANTEPEEYIRFNIMHHNEAKGPVDGSFQFKLVKAVVDMENLDASFAEYEVDLGTVVTGIEKRDNHLKSADFFDVAGFPTAKVKVHKIAPNEGGDYSATASLDLHGIQADVPVNFKIIENLEGGGIVIEGSAPMTRSQFSVGADPATTGAADPLTVNVRLQVVPTS